MGGGNKQSSAPMLPMRNTRIRILAMTAVNETAMNALSNPIINLLLSSIATVLETFREVRRDWVTDRVFVLPQPVMHH